jgi:hypothetical protein
MLKGSLAPATPAPYYRGPYILGRDANGTLRFYPAKQQGGVWVALSEREVAEQTR